MILHASPAGASGIVESGERLFVQQGSNDPIVVLAALDGFDQPEGSDLAGLASPAGGQWHAGVGSLIVEASAARRPVGVVSTAVLRLGVSEVQVGAEVRSDDGDPSSGVVLHSGPDGELRVVLLPDGVDHRLELLLIDDGGGTTRLASGAAFGGAMTRAVIRVESRNSVVTAWLDGAEAFTHTLVGPLATAVAAQTAHGIVLGRDADSVDDVRVLALG